MQKGRRKEDGGKEAGGRRKEKGERKKEKGERRKEKGERRKEEGGRRKEEGGRRKEEGGRRKEEGGRRKEEGGRRKEEGGRRKEEGGRRKEEGGRRKEEGGRRKEEGGRRKEEGGRRRKVSSFVRVGRIKVLRRLMERKTSLLLSRLRTMEEYSGYYKKKDQCMNEQRRFWSHSGALIMETEDWDHPHSGQKREKKQEDQEENRKSLFGLESFRSGIWKEVVDFGLGAVSLSDRSEVSQE